MDSESPREPSARRLALLDELRQDERRAVSSHVASVIGHLIGTPLHVIAGRASLIQANPTPESAVENARRIEQQVEQVAQRVRTLIDYLTAPQPEVQPTSVAAVVHEALSFSAPCAAERSVTVAGPSGSLPDATVDGRSALIVLTSLLSLATRVTPNAGTIELALPVTEGTAVRFDLLVPGMQPPQGRIDRLEPPQAWSRPQAEQLQVLSVCFAIAKKSGGRIEVAGDGEDRALVRFYCPCV